MSLSVNGVVFLAEDFVLLSNNWNDKIALNFQVTSQNRDGTFSKLDCSMFIKPADTAAWTEKLEVGNVFYIEHGLLQTKPSKNTAFNTYRIRLEPEKFKLLKLK